MKPLVLLCALAIALLAVVSAVAHAEPVRVTPGDGAVLNSAPDRVVMEMSQEMARSAGRNDIDVFDAAGKEVTEAAAVIDDSGRKRLSVALPGGLAPGAYSVRWTTLSADDGDDASGQTTFTYDPGATPVAGKEILREDLLGGGATPPPASAIPEMTGSGSNGMSWVLVAAVGAGMLVLGAGGAYLLVQKRQ